MEKFQINRTALEALQFLISSDLGFSTETVNSLKCAFWCVCENLKDLVKPLDE